MAPLQGAGDPAGPEEPGQVAPSTQSEETPASADARPSIRSLIFPSFSVASAKLEILTICEQLMKTSDLFL